MHANDDVLIATGQAAGGAQIICFTTGRGSAMPVISQRIFDAIIRHASGDKVRSEVLGDGNDEFLPWQVGAVM